MAIDHFARNHVEKLEAFVLKGREDIGLRRQRYEIRLDHDTAAIIVDIAEQAVLIASTSPTALHIEPFPPFYVTPAPPPLQAPKQRRPRETDGPRPTLPHT